VKWPLSRCVVQQTDHEPKTTEPILSGTYPNRFSGAADPSDDGGS